MDPNDLFHIRNEILQIWWLFAAMLVFMMQVGFLLLETGLIQERHQAGIAVKSMMMLLASSTAYTLIGHYLVWGHSAGPLGTAEWQFYQTGFAAVAAAILSGAMAGRTTLVSNVIMAALVGAFFYPVHAWMVWGGGFLSHEPLKVHDFAGSGSVHLLGGLIALAGALAAGPRREKRNWRHPDIPIPMHITPRSLPLAACGVLFLWIGWMGFNGGSIQSAYRLNLVGRLLISTCLAASSGGFAVSFVAGIIRVFRGKRYVYAPYATLSGIMAGMVANSASCDLIASSSLSRSLVVGAVAGIFAYGVNWVVQQYFHVDDPIEAIAVHAGGGLVGLIFAGLYQSPWNPWHIWPQCVDIAVLVSITVMPSWIIFKVMDRIGRLTILERTPIRLKSTSDEENLGLTFDDPATRVGLSPVHFHYLPDDLKRQIFDYLNLLTSTAAHVARRLHKKSGELIAAIKRLPPENLPQSSDLAELDKFQEELCQRIEAVPLVLRRLQTGYGEPVWLDDLVLRIAREYGVRYPKVTITVNSPEERVYVNGDEDLTREAIRMVVSNGVNAGMQRFDRRGDQYEHNDYEPSVLLRIEPQESEGQVLLYVEDNGIGIDAETRHYLGQPFTGFTSDRGYGLGLFFAAWITMHFGGRLDCEGAKDPQDEHSNEKTVFIMRFRLERSL